MNLIINSSMIIFNKSCASAADQCYKLDNIFESFNLEYFSFIKFGVLLQNFEVYFENIPNHV